jgi:ABC-type oligopeptide transport system substrate-binding subunit
MIHRFCLVAVLAAVLVPAGSAGTPTAPVLRLASSEDVGTLDPQAEWTANLNSFTLLRATCTTLMAFPERFAARGDAVSPDGAVAAPRVSSDRRTYTFVIRPDLRFSDGRAVTAAAYARAIERLRDPVMHPPTQQFSVSFYAADIAAIHARGRVLSLTLRSPAGDLLTRLAMPVFCPVPRDTPSDPDGIPLTIGSGPYHLVEQVPARSILLGRNPFYRGPRKAEFGSISVAIGGTPQSLFQDVARGTYDYAFDPVPRDLARQAVAQYGVGRGRLFYVPSISLFYSLLNLRSPLFRDNLPLRKAIGYAIDRPELFRPYPFGAHRSAQLIPPGIAGFSPAANVFPITGADVRTARRLARGHLRGRHAVLYSLPSPDNLRQSEIIKYNLGQIGLDVEIRPFSFSALFTKLADPAERWDLTGGISWFADYPDPSDFMTPLFTTLPGGYWNLSGLNDPGLNRRVLAANRLLGPRRIRAFARIAHDLVRDVVPVVPLGAGQGMRLVSARVGCVHFEAGVGVDLSALCLLS